MSEDGEQRSRPRKLRRRKSEQVMPEPVDVSSQDSMLPSVISKVLMVEVENITHDPFKVTEEVKVRIIIHHAVCN